MVNAATSPYDFLVDTGGDPEITPWVKDPVVPEVPNVGIDFADCGELLPFASDLNAVADGFRVFGDVTDS